MNGFFRRTLPCYLLLGQPGSGKTRMLAASGLQPVLSAGGACCDGYASDAGLLLDTAGRCLTQPDREVDGRDWSTLLGLLNKRRREQPLNGVVVALSMERLLADSEAALVSHAREVRSRLLEIQQRLGMRLPVYLIVTQADRLPGFIEFAGAGVVGEYLGPAVTTLGQVRQGFAALLQRLNGELVSRLHQERDGVRSGRILDFPRQMEQLGERLYPFIDVAFYNPADQRADRLHAVYFNSALAPGPSASFLQGIFNPVILAEAGLAGFDRHPLRRRAWRQAGLAVAVVGVLGAAGLAWLYSYAANHQRLEQVRALYRPAPASPSFRAILPVLEARWAATQVFASPQPVAPFERLGLYQGDLVRPSLDQAYARALGEWLQPQVGDLLEAQVRASLEDRDRLLDSLRAYLMLQLPERRDPAWLGERLAAQWRVLFADEPLAQARLSAHFTRLLQQPFVQPLNDALVAQARQVLRGESLVGMVYRTLQEQARDLEPYRLGAAPAFEGDYAVPGFYTRRYLRYFDEQGERLVHAIVQDNWVLGASTDFGAMDVQRLIAALEQRYFTDYAEAWGQAIGQLRLRAADDLAQGEEPLASLGSAPSPLLQLLQQIRDNTDLLATETGAEEPAHSELPQTPRRALQQRFAPLHQLLDAGQAPGEVLGQALQALGEVHGQWLDQRSRYALEQAAFVLAKRRFLQQGSALDSLRDAALQLPAPLDAWLQDLANQHWRSLLDAAYQHVNRRYQSEVHSFYSQAIRPRYPFDAQASDDVALDDFHGFFSPQGRLARFFRVYLRPFVSVEGGRYTLRSLDGARLPIARDVLDQQVNADWIRHNFYADDPQHLQVSFTLAPHRLDPAISRARLEFGGQRMEYRHGPIMPVAFKWPSSAENGRVRVELARHAEPPLRYERNTGAWSLFRLVAQMQAEPGSEAGQLILRVGAAGAQVNYLMTCPGSPCLFQTQAWSTFQLPEQL